MQEPGKSNLNIFMSVLILIIFISCSKSPDKSGVIELKSGWKFIDGDSIDFAKVDFDDSNWANIDVDKTWDKQGYSINKSFAWYRIKMVIPSSIKKDAFYKDSLIIHLGKIDDANQIFFNGVLIGENLTNITNGAASGNAFKDSYWDDSRRYSLALDDELIQWDRENVIAVRVLNWNGPGGIYTGEISVGMQDIKDYLKMQINKNLFTFKGQFLEKEIILKNRSDKYPIDGNLNVIMQDNINKNIFYNRDYKISLSAKEEKKLQFQFLKSEQSAIVKYKLSFDNSVNTMNETEGVPYILTPPIVEKPQINGALIYGQRPNRPFLYRIPVSGKRPLHFEVKGLPEGLTVNAETGIIKGVVHKKGAYNIHVSVSNKYGADNKVIKLEIGDRIALTPPMGWNSWNCWGLSVTQDRVYAAAKAFIDKGLADHGWSYINIDDGWEIYGKSSEPKRKRNGEIRTNEKFPDMKKLGDDIHHLGLKFGIYSSPGPLTCGGYTASYRHELQDARSFAEWGVDYLKYDLCTYREFMKSLKDKKELMPPYQVMNRALSKLDRDMIYSLCEYGYGDVWQWGSKVGGNLWRTTGDIYDEWERLFFIGFNQETAAPYSAPGHWNDPDMLVIGWLGWSDHLHPSYLTPDEQYTHVSLWALLSAPLLLGCDLEKLDDFTLNLITNDEVLAIDQDPLGVQALPVIKEKNIHVYKKRLADGNYALGIFNISDETVTYKLSFINAGLNKELRLRDLWRQKDLGNFSNVFEDAIPSHGVRLLKAFE